MGFNISLSPLPNACLTVAAAVCDTAAGSVFSSDVTILANASSMLASLTDGAVAEKKRVAVPGACLPGDDTAKTSTILGARVASDG
eukprot:CAMPEP_0183418976 /NCGR_PEP_ID=MMETSP0370-20130417/25471_1 /TAXON_ID=268820 /ORGANISM="Peridinium aciculiferum, Strain PAER-2" /LENGTH=85 /DNA_ID=CAMNT_0025602739 /DNA_START=397 /DNA_END=654 /DNA_ORIENTATION=-